MGICVAFQTLEFDITFLNKESIHIGVDCILMDIVAFSNC